MGYRHGVELPRFHGVVGWAHWDVRGDLHPWKPGRALQHRLSDRTEETVQADVPGKASPGDGGLYRYDVCNRDLRFRGRPKDPRAHIHFHAVVRPRLVRRLVHPVRTKDAEQDY